MNKYKIPIEFPHTIISSFISQLKNFIKYEVYPFKTINISTFQKEIQYLQQLQQDRESVEVGIRIPYLLLQPTLAEPVKESETFWRSSAEWDYLSTYFYQPVIDQYDSKLYVITRRFTGTIDLRIFADSVMELHDIQVAFLDKFRGFNMILYLNNIRMGIILADTLKITREDDLPLFDWSKVQHSETLIPSIDQTFDLLMVKNPPQIRLETLNDASTFFGGTGLPEYALAGTIRYELEIPTYMVILTKSLIKSITGNIMIQLIGIDSQITTRLVAIMEGETVKVAEVIASEIADTYSLENCKATVTTTGIDLQNDSFIVRINGRLISSTEFTVHDAHTLVIDFCKIYDRMPRDLPLIEIIKYKEARCPAWLSNQN